MHVQTNWLWSHVHGPVPLTTGPGTWIEIISRIGEPVLLGFAAVAARGRVQR